MLRQIGQALCHFRVFLFEFSAQFVRHALGVEGGPQGGHKTEFGTCQRHLHGVTEHFSRLVNGSHMSDDAGRLIVAENAFLKCGFKRRRKAH